MATTIGVFFMLFPKETAFALLFIAAVLAATHNSDLSFAVGFARSPVFMFPTVRPLSLIVYVVPVLPLIGSSG